MVTARVCAVVRLLDAGVTVTVGVAGGGGGVDPPPPQPLKTARTQLALIPANKLDLIHWLLL